ncbi:protein of unknown function [Methylocella tundrae]|uniref:Uncharacterized protein n=1 Tax=Methylocella tundrae TaxID=227605 RepID=A0A4U8Z4P7_METTU|nr:protein of unknown function [Methylocella tundrae]
MTPKIGAFDQDGIAAIAQLVEHLIRNEGVGGSNPSCGTSKINMLRRIFLNRRCHNIEIVATVSPPQGFEKIVHGFPLPAGDSIAAHEWHGVEIPSGRGARAIGDYEPLGQVST